MPIALEDVFTSRQGRKLTLADVMPEARPMSDKIQTWGETVSAQQQTGIAKFQTRETEAYEGKVQKYLQDPAWRFAQRMVRPLSVFGLGEFLQEQFVSPTEPAEEAWRRVQAEDVEAVKVGGWAAGTDPSWVGRALNFYTEIIGTQFGLEAAGLLGKTGQATKAGEWLVKKALGKTIKPGMAGRMVSQALRATPGAPLLWGTYSGAKAVGEGKEPAQIAAEIGKGAATGLGLAAASGVLAGIAPPIMKALDKLYESNRLRYHRLLGQIFTKMGDIPSAKLQQHLAKGRDYMFAQAAVKKDIAARRAVQPGYEIVLSHRKFAPGFARVPGTVGPEGEAIVPKPPSPLVPGGPEAKTILPGAISTIPGAGELAPAKQPWEIAEWSKQFGKGIYFNKNLPGGFSTGNMITGDLVIGTKGLSSNDIMLVTLHEVGHRVETAEGTFHPEIKDAQLRAEVDATEWALNSAAKYGVNISNADKLFPFAMKILKKISPDLAAKAAVPAEAKPAGIAPEKGAGAITPAEAVQLVRAQLPTMLPNRIATSFYAGLESEAKAATTHAKGSPLADVYALGQYARDNNLSGVVRKTAGHTWAIGDNVYRVDSGEVIPTKAVEGITGQIPPPPKKPPPSPPSEDPAGKLTDLIKQAKPARAKITGEYAQERAKRFAAIDKFIETQIDNVGGEEGYAAILSKLKGELIPPESKIRFEPVKHKLSQDDLQNLFLQTWKHPYLSTGEKVSAANGLMNLLSGEIPQPRQLLLLEEIYGPEMIKAILSKRALGARIFDFVLELANLPRAILATADMSAFLRQGAVYITHPAEFFPAVARTFQFAFSPHAYKDYFNDVRKSPQYPLLKKAGIDITAMDRKAEGLAAREEPFISRLQDNIPVLKYIFGFANRSYSGFLSKLRIDIFNDWAAELESKGFSPQKDLDIFKSAAEVVNTFSGRGNLGNLNRVTPHLNALFFSPRLNVARFNTLNPAWYAKQPKAIRTKALADFGKFIAIGLSTLTLIKIWSSVYGKGLVTVEFDPRSADFGKARIGNTRWDIWAGFQQWARVFTQLITGQRKNTRTGEIVSLTKDDYPFTTRKEVLLRFIESKLAPVPALINELISGSKTYSGEDLDLETVVKERFIPMYIQDIADAYQDNGLGRAVGAGAAAFVGVGVQTYPPRFKVKMPPSGGSKYRPNYRKTSGQKKYAPNYTK